MHEAARMSFERLSKSAPWICLGSFVVIAATFLAYRKLYVLAVFMAPIAGVLMFISWAAYWRTEKEWLANLPLGIVIILSINTSAGGLLWGFPQSLAFAFLFMALPLVVLRRPLSRWLDRRAA